mgnify:CR=1 FL=1
MWLEQIRKITTPVKAQQPTSYRQREDAARRLALAGATRDENLPLLKCEIPTDDRLTTMRFQRRHDIDGHIAVGVLVANAAVSLNLGLRQAFA